MKKQIKLSKEEIRIFYKVLNVVKENQNESFKTIEEFYIDYLNYLSTGFTKSYYRSHLTTYNHLISHFRKDMLLSEITKKAAEDFIQVIKRSAPRGVNVYIRNLKAALNKAIEWEYLEENPFKRVRKARFQKEEEKVLTLDEFNLIFDELYMNEVIRAIAAFAFHSGCRLSEVINLRWENIDLKNETVTIGDKNFTTKSKKIRGIPLTFGMGLSIEPFFRNRGKFDYVFCKSNGYPFTGNHVSKKFKKAVKKLEMDGSVRFHSLRHSYASNLTGRGVPVHLVAKLLGHSSQSTTERYSHINVEELRKQLEGKL
jgi:integrase